MIEMPVMSMQRIQHFEAQVETGPGCWKWLGCCTTGGYGIVCIDHKNIRAHRLAYHLWKGKLFGKLLVRHICDNPQCVNPDHLELGDNQDNMTDKVIHGRSSFGSRNGMAILTDEVVSQIKQLLSSHTNKFLGKKFNVHSRTICDIRIGNTWSNI